MGNETETGNGKRKPDFVIYKQNENKKLERIALPNGKTINAQYGAVWKNKGRESGKEYLSIRIGSRETGYTRYLAFPNEPPEKPKGKQTKVN